MKTLRYIPLLIALVWCDQCAAQSYMVIAETSFATRINYNSPSYPQQSRVAGSDHMVSKFRHDKLALELNDTGGSVVIKGKQYPLTAEQSQRLRIGISAVVNKKFELTLSSDASDRSRALLFVRSVPAKDLAILQLIELELVTISTNQAEPPGAGQPAGKPTANKVPAEVQPPTPASKDGPR